MLGQLIKRPDSLAEKKGEKGIFGRVDGGPQVVPFDGQAGAKAGNVISKQIEMEMAGIGELGTALVIVTENILHRI